MHPDRHPENREEAEERFKEMQVACCFDSGEAEDCM